MAIMIKVLQWVLADSTFSFIVVSRYQFTWLVGGNKWEPLQNFCLAYDFNNIEQTEVTNILTVAKLHFGKFFCTTFLSAWNRSAAFSISPSHKNICRGFFWWGRGQNIRSDILKKLIVFAKVVIYFKITCCSILLPKHMVPLLSSKTHTKSSVGEHEHQINDQDFTSQEQTRKGLVKNITLSEDFWFIRA